MLFKPELCEKILRDEKTQTRRLVKPGEKGAIYPDGRIWAVWDRSGHLKWEVGRTYAVCPGCGKPGIGRIRLTAIRKEGLLELSREDEIAEGFHLEGYFFITWNRIHNMRGERVLDNPDVWVLEFELVPEPEPA
jgi:hypothetical protein